MSLDPVMRRALAVGMVAPDLVVVAALSVQWWLLGDLPDTVITHWGPQGADGDGPAWTYPILTLALGLGLPAMMMAFTLPSLRRGERSPMLRLMPAIGLGVATLIAAISTGALLIQRDVDSGSAPGIGTVVAGAYLLAALAGVLGWLAQPRQELAQPSLHTVGPLPVAPGETVVWLGRAEAGAWLMTLLIGVTLVLVAAAAWMWIAGDALAAVILSGVAALIAALTAISTVFRVRADLSGLTVRSPLGWPRFRVPAEDIADASVIGVSGLAEFGGWGIRMAPGATGLILRNGGALQVTRRNGRRLVVTLEDPTTPAAVLTAAAERNARADQD